MRAVDVRERCCKLEKPEGCHKGTVIGEGDAVFCGSEAKGQQHRQVPPVDGVTEMSGHQRSNPFVYDNLRAAATSAYGVPAASTFRRQWRLRGGTLPPMRAAVSLRYGTP